MKTIKSTIIIILLTGIFTLSGCKKNNTEIPKNEHNDAYGDVISKKMIINEQEKYILMVFAGGENIQANGSSVKAPDGTIYDLHSFWAGPEKLTGKSQIRNSLPDAGSYTFTLKFSDGYVKTLTDVLEGKNTTVPQITVNYNTDVNPQTINVSWTESPEADFYCIKITDLDMANNKPYYKKPMIDKSQNSFTITVDGSNGWLRSVDELQNGKEYFIVVSAKKVESGTPVNGMSQNLEINGCSKTKITYQN